MKEIKTRKIPAKNYILVGVLFVAVVLLLWYFSKWYQVYNDYQRKTPVIRGTLSEITDLELDHYLMENPTAVIYMCTSSASRCRNFEKSFKKVLEQDEVLKTNIIYLNLSDINQEEFVNEFNQKYSYKSKLTTNYPALVLFEDGKVIGLLQEKKDKNLNASEVQSYLHLHDIGEDVE